MRSSYLFLALVIISVLPVSANAQDKKEASSQSEKTTVLAKQNGPSGPVKEWIDAENAMIDPLPSKAKESVFILRNKHSVIRVIGVVERDIGSAVKACGKANPDMKSNMEDRFTQWKNAVNPIIKTAKKQLDADIDGQKIVDAKEFRRVMKLNDKAFEYGEKQIQKTPVTTKEACAGLLASMDRTEDDMIQLLRQTLLPESVIQSRAKAADKAEKKNFSESKPKTEEKKEPSEQPKKQ